MIVAMGMASGFLWDVFQGNLAFLGMHQKALPTVASYWRATNLSSDDLEDLIQDEVCRSSAKYFLSCANALNAIAGKLHLQIGLDQSISELPEPKANERDLPLEFSTERELTEKIELKRWANFYETQAEDSQDFSFLKIWKDIQREHLSDSEAKLESASIVAAGLNGFLSVFKDPHTYLLPANYYHEVVAPLSTRSNSLGVILVRGANHYFIRKVLEQSPAEQSGLKKGDLLLRVNTQTIVTKSLSQIGALLKAEEGEITHLTVQRGSDEIEIKIPRWSQEIPTITWKIDQEKNLGILVLNKFAKGSCQRSQEALSEFRQQRIQGVLLDLRDNGGGQLDEAACVASLFLGKNREVSKLYYFDQDRGIESLQGTHQQIYFGSLAVLINSGTASAAEIVAGVLQEYRRGVLVGERTFGKGTFQEGELWEGNTEIALFETKGLFTMPSGRSPQLVGILPDVPVKFRDSQVIREEDLYFNPIRPKAKMGPLSRSAPKTRKFLSQKQKACSNPNQNSKDKAGYISKSLYDSNYQSNYDPQFDRAVQLVMCNTLAEKRTDY